MGTNWAGLPDLAGLRRKKGLTLDAIAHDTKIGTRYLDAIERGQFEKLPGGVYDTSFIRQYARAVAFDEISLLDYYNHSKPS